MTFKQCIIYKHIEDNWEIAFTCCPFLCVFHSVTSINANLNYLNPHLLYLCLCLQEHCLWASLGPRDVWLRFLGCGWWECFVVVSHREWRGCWVPRSSNYKRLVHSSPIKYLVLQPWPAIGRVSIVNVNGLGEIPLALFSSLRRGCVSGMWEVWGDKLCTFMR